EALARATGSKERAARGAVEDRVAHDDVLMRYADGPLKGTDDDLPSREPLAQVIVGFADQRKPHPGRQKRPKRLPRRPAKNGVKAALGKAPVAKAAGDRVGQRRSHGPIRVGNR